MLSADECARKGRKLDIESIKKMDKKTRFQKMFLNDFHNRERVWRREKCHL